jgi:hypothetical protein
MEMKCSKLFIQQYITCQLNRVRQMSRKAPKLHALHDWIYIHTEGCKSKKLVWTYTLYYSESNLLTSYCY